MMKQTTAVQYSMTAAVLRKSITKLEAIPPLSQGNAADGLKTEDRGEKGAQTSRVVLGRRAKNGQRRCQAPRASQASAGHVSGLPGQLS